MTVAELIAELSNWDDHTIVAFSDSEVGPREVETVQYATWTQGPYDDPEGNGCEVWGVIIGASY